MRTITTSRASCVKAKEQDTDKACLEVSMKLDKLFNGVEYELVWAKARNGKVGVMITYKDFLSVGLLGRMLKDIIPSEIHVNLKREYSDEVLARILLDEFKKNRIGVVDCYGGSLVTEPIRAYVYRLLSSVELN